MLNCLSNVETSIFMTLKIVRSSYRNCLTEYQDTGADGKYGDRLYGVIYMKFMKVEEL